MYGAAAGKGMILMDSQHKPLCQQPDQAVSHHGRIAVPGCDAEVAVIHKQMFRTYVVAEKQLDVRIFFVKSNVEIRHVGGCGQHQQLDVAEGLVGELPDLPDGVVKLLDALIHLLVKKLSRPV